MFGIDVPAQLARLFPISPESTSSRGRPVVECHDPKQLRDELIQLLNKQLDSLERETFGGLTTTERREYAEMRHRIYQLHDELSLLRTAA
jgi:hypothetical protein